MVKSKGKLFLHKEKLTDQVCGIIKCYAGPVAHLARALRWQRRGEGFESPQVHI
jgi:hypothetical protein